MPHEGRCAVQQAEQHQRIDRAANFFRYLEPRDLYRILAFAHSSARDLDVPPSTRVPEMTNKRDLATKAREDCDTRGLFVTGNNPMVEARLPIWKYDGVAQENNIGIFVHNSGACPLSGHATSGEAIRHDRLDPRHFGALRYQDDTALRILGKSRSRS